MLHNLAIEVSYVCLSMVTHSIVHVGTDTWHEYDTLGHMSKLCNINTFSRYIILMYHRTINGCYTSIFDVSFTGAWGQRLDV